MQYARVWARVRLDKTGALTELPVILMMRGGALTVLEPLLRYFVRYHQTRGQSWMLKLCQAVSQLLEYLEAHQSEPSKPVDLFQAFSDAMYRGTFDKQNNDPSGLCWFPSNTKTTNAKLYVLEEFADWMASQGYVGETLNPWTEATSSEKRLNWIAWYRRNQFSFLGHLGLSSSNAAALEQARQVKLRRQPMGALSRAKAFPAGFEIALLRDGFVRPGKENEKDILKKFDWRGICITLLLLYGARRLSEPFHLWTGDVMENPVRPGEALVRIYHPVHGQAPEFPKLNRRRAPNRQAYLQAFYPNYPPRNLARGSYHAGFKSQTFADDEAKYLHVYWLPSDMGEAFLSAYHNYMRQRAQMGLDGLRHPFAFVSHKKSHRGEPYTIKSFEKAWERAITRIGLPYAKMHGTTPHGGRHASGLRANKAGVSVYDAQEMFGHSSPESQRVYRMSTPEQVTESLDAATLRLRQDSEMPPTSSSITPPRLDPTELWRV